MLTGEKERKNRNIEDKYQGCYDAEHAGKKKTTATQLGAGLYILLQYITCFIQNNKQANEETRSEIGLIQQPFLYVYTALPIT